MTAPQAVTPRYPRVVPEHGTIDMLPNVGEQSFPTVKLRGTRTGWPTVAAHLAVDLVMIAATLAATGWLVAVVATYSWRLGLAVLAALVASAAAQGLYRAIPLHPAAQLQRWCLVIFIVLAVGAIIATEIAVWMAVTAPLLAIAVFLGRAALRWAFSGADWWGVRVIILGSDAAKAGERLCQRPSLGMLPVGIVDELEAARQLPSSLPWLGPASALGDIARRYGVERAVVAVHGFEAGEIASLVGHPASGVRHWMVLPPFEQFPSLWNSAREVGGAPALEMSNLLASPFQHGLKRAFDLSLTAALGTVIVPLIGLIALLVRLSSRGPVFYSQERIGWHGRRFRAWKIRTMRPDADQVLEEYLAQNPHLRAEWLANHKLKNDPRTTWLGRWLRLSSLDELPQIWNVLRGEMSLIGPRPIVEAEIEKYGDQYEHYIRVLPGVTGLWQISGRNNTTYQERVDYDAYYVMNWSPWLDLYILACTVRVVLLGEGAY